MNKSSIPKGTRINSQTINSTKDIIHFINEVFRIVLMKYLDLLIQMKKLGLLGYIVVYELWSFKYL